MPIYAYRCEACGFAKDVLQKVSDAPLTTCLACGKPTFKKQLTAAGFQLKGTGWYVTDFRGGSSGTSSTAPSGSSGETAASGTTSSPAAASTSAPATSTDSASSGTTSGTAAAG